MVSHQPTARFSPPPEKCFHVYHKFISSHHNHPNIHENKYTINLITRPFIFHFFTTIPIPPFFFFYFSQTIIQTSQILLIRCSHLQGGSQNLERPNIERPVFRKFETSNIEITKVKLFDFLYFFQLQYFENLSLFQIEQF